MRRFTLAAVCLACLPALGCVEGEQTFTLNPDGSGKVTFDVTMTPPFEPFPGQPAKKPEDTTLDDMLAGSVGTLLRAKGVAAWKDVTASFAPDGRFRFAGTAYFKTLADLEFQNAAPLLGTPLGATAGPGGALTLAPKKPKGGPGEPGFGLFKGGKSPAELALLPDAEVDDLVMRERVRYQSSRPLLVAMLTDAKVKTTFVLPGRPGKVPGYQADGNALSVTLDGAKVIAGMNKVFETDAAGLRKLVRSEDGSAALAQLATGLYPPESTKIVVAKPTGPQFDFDAEVKAARAAYPELRKKLKLPENVPPPQGSAAAPKGTNPK